MGNHEKSCTIIFKNYTPAGFGLHRVFFKDEDWPVPEKGPKQLLSVLLGPFDIREIIIVYDDTKNAGIELKILYFHPQMFPLTADKQTIYLNEPSGRISREGVFQMIIDRDDIQDTLTFTLADPVYGDDKFIEEGNDYDNVAGEALANGKYENVIRMYQFLEKEYFFKTGEIIPHKFENFMLRARGAIEALKINKEGEKLMEEEKYEAALVKFLEAETKTKEKHAREAIVENRLLAYGFLNMDVTIEAFFIKVDRALEDDLYDEAIKHLDEGWHLADSPSVLDRFKFKKSSILVAKAEPLFDKGFTIEAKTTDKAPEQALSKFEEARKYLQEAQDLKPFPEQEKMLKLVELKIEGNLLFKEALEMEISSLKEFQDSMDIDVWSKYENALTKYEEVKKKFEEPAKEDNRFKENLQLVQKVLDNARKMLQEMTSAMLLQIIGNLEMEDWEEETEDDDEIDLNNVMSGI